MIPSNAKISKRDREITIGLKLIAAIVIGVNEEERDHSQPIAIEASIGLLPGNPSPAYAHALREIFKRTIRKAMDSSKPFLLERMVYLIATAVLDQHLDVSAVEITARKKNAVRSAAHAYATIKARRPDPLC